MAPARNRAAARVQPKRGSKKAVPGGGGSHHDAAAAGGGGSRPTATGTVRFNVGGQDYEVSRSLLARHPGTMMARMADEAWCGAEAGSAAAAAAPTFIDRDGERFRYVLDYMRDGEVHLPVTISKKGLLLDMKYYGFDLDDGDDDGSGRRNEDITQGTVAELRRIADTLEEGHAAEIEELDRLIKASKGTIDSCQKKKAAIKTSQVLFKLFRDGGGGNGGGCPRQTTIRVERGEYGTDSNVTHGNAGQSLAVQDYLNDCLAVYGLGLVSAETDYSGVGITYAFVLKRLNEN